MKLATFRSGGREKVGLVHSNDSRLFDLAAASGRNGGSNPAFVSMLGLIDAGPAALDQATARAILELMKRLNAERGITFVFSSHDPAILTIANRVVRLVDGELA